MIEHPHVKNRALPQSVLGNATLLPSNVTAEPPGAA